MSVLQPIMATSTKPTQAVVDGNIKKHLPVNKKNRKFRNAMNRKDSEIARKDLEIAALRKELAEQKAARQPITATEQNREHKEAQQKVLQLQRQLAEKIREHVAAELQMQRDTCERIKMINLSIAFLELCRELGVTTASIGGSTVTKMMESMIHGKTSAPFITQSEPSECVDLDIMLCENKMVYGMHCDKVAVLIKLLQDGHKASRYLDRKFGEPRYIFGTYIIADFKEVTMKTDEKPNGTASTLGIPHFKISLRSGESVIVLDIMAYPPPTSEVWTYGDFAHKMFRFSHEGITINGNHTHPGFFDALHSVIAKKIDIHVPVEKLYQKSIESKTCALRNGYLEQLLYFYGVRLYKALRSGYYMSSDVVSSTQSFLQFKLETKEPCTITSLDPPYIAMHVSCKCFENKGRWLSTMALGGLVASKTNCIRCPYCSNGRSLMGDVGYKLITAKQTPLPKLDIFTLGDDFDVGVDDNGSERHATGDPILASMLRHFSGSVGMRSEID